MEKLGKFSVHCAARESMMLSTPLSPLGRPPLRFAVVVVSMPNSKNDVAVALLSVYMSDAETSLMLLLSNVHGSACRLCPSQTQVLMSNHVSLFSLDPFPGAGMTPAQR
jgi:hypothetical protein